MSITAKIEANFPGKWTGGSSIHRSFATKVFTGKSHVVREVMKGLIEEEIPHKVWSFLHSRFGKCEWLLDEKEFSAIMLQDVYGHLIGLGSTLTDQMLKNPATGNIFHRIALFENIVCGIRYWVWDDRKVHFRFRLEEQLEEENKVRSTIRASAEKAVAAVAEIMIELDIQEPSHVYEESEKEVVYELI